MRIPGAICALLMLWFAGCSQKTWPLEGVVITNENLAMCTLVDYPPTFRPEGEPVAQAVVYFAMDQRGERRIKGFQTISDKEGKYKISTEGLPPPEDEDGYYCLVVEREGYETLVYEISLRALSRKFERVVYLKKK